MIGRRSHDDAQSFDRALHGGQAVDDQMADLVRLAEDLCEAAALDPSPLFRDSLRARLMTEAATVLVSMPAKPAKAAAPIDEPRARRRLAGLAATLVASAGAVGLVASSASAVPGEMLYPVKRSVESVELKLHRSDASRGEFQLARASERLAEARKLSTDSGSAGLIAETLDDFSEAATDGSARLFSEYDASGEEQAVNQINDFAADASVDLSALSAQLPPDAAGSLDAAKAAVTSLAAEASTLCSTCVPADLRTLSNAVDKSAGKTSKPQAQAPSKAPDAMPSSRPATTTAPAAVPTPRPSAVASTTPPPVPALPSKTPALTDLTDPLLGGLLGDDDQVGIVPGLLNGLLGTPK